MSPPSDATAGPRLRRASDIVLRSAVLVGAVVAIGAGMWMLRIVVLPVFIALLICTALTPPVVALERRGMPSLAATWLVYLLALGALAVAVGLIVPPTVDEFSGLGPVVADGIDDLGDWLVEGPPGLDEQQVEEYTGAPVDRLTDMAQDSSSRIWEGVRTVGETAAGALLAMVLTFLFLKDGRRFQIALLERLPDRYALVTRAVGRRVWESFGGFLRGAAILGIVEGAIIGSTMALVGAPLALPVAVLTLLGAFFPIVGAVVAGGVATLVTLGTVGIGPALVVLAVAIAVQQFDADLLAPFIYGRSLELHPAAVLVGLTAGAALGGIIGAFIAVPVMSAGWGAAQELWNHRVQLDPAPAPSEVVLPEGVDREDQM